MFFFSFFHPPFLYEIRYPPDHSFGKTFFHSFKKNKFFFHICFTVILQLLPLFCQ